MTMAQLTQEQRDAVQAAGWTEDEVTAFTQAIASFRDSLPPRQQEALNAILATAGAAASGDEVQGYLVVISIIAILIGQLQPDRPVRPPTR
jgi:hypothetical protein